MATHPCTWLSTQNMKRSIVQCLLSTPATDTFAVASNMQGGDKVPGHNDFVPLHFVATQGSLSIVNMLLGHHPECRADKYRPIDLILMKSRSEKTWLHHVAEQSHWHVVYDLLGAVKRIGIHQVVDYLHIWRQTPLHLAVFNQSIETVEILLKDGEGLKVNATHLGRYHGTGHGQTWQWENCANVKKLWCELVASRSQEVCECSEFYLVGVALIAGVTYASWLQPPLGFVLS